MRPARPLAVLLPLAFVLSIAGCGDALEPRAWAASVCTTLEPWRTEIGSLTTRTQQEMSAATTPGQAKENLSRLFGGAADASERARAGVVKAGVPDVDNGKQIADGFTGSLAATRDAYARARTGVEALPTVPADDFYQKVPKVVDQLNQEYQASSLDTSSLNSTELKNAFDQVPECR
ncbi:hypothetical protein ACWKSP_25040 [Micromonosporaceae bacterium Da 78-11]